MASVSMHPAEMLFIGTFGGARCRHGKPVRQLRHWQRSRLRRGRSVTPAALYGPMTHAVRSADAALARDQTLFLLLMGVRDTSIAEVYVKGRRVQ
jgi:guanine deaminase